jgi:glycyl-tRNA synthetase beta chain
MQDFLLEIGTEEIPASFLKPATEALERETVGWFNDNRVAFGRNRTVYTPRRLALLVSDVAEQQEAKTVELQGPPKKAAFDPEGKPTKTALGFARTHGKEVADLVVKTTAKGEYVFVTKTIPAQPVIPLLSVALPAIVARLPFPKNMRWASGDFRFARPIRWIVALLGSEAIPFKIEDVSSGNTTCGLRLARVRELAIASPGEYEKTLEQAGIVADPVRRQQAVAEAIQAVLAGKGELIPDEELLEETAGIVEAPCPVLCDFRPEYLALPPIVVVTALKRHQRCFAVRHPSSRSLLPMFVAVTNTPGCAADEVRQWYEKAAESRLKDASFFIEEDRKVGLDGFLHQEEQVTWIEELGTLKDKTARLIRLCEELAALVNAGRAGETSGVIPQAHPTFVTTSSGPTRVDLEALRRAAQLCKADLLSNMVREKEYTSLQGVMGGIYARMLGESETTAQAIADHYAPRSIGDPLPATAAGKLLSIADKLDNLCAAFVSGSIPTGSTDPFALRRQTTGALLMVLELERRFDLRAMLRVGLELLGNVESRKVEKSRSQESADAEAKLFDQLAAFVRERLNLLFAEQGVKYDIANAVLEVAWFDPADARKRCAALAQFRSTEEFEKLIIGQKRVANILKGVDARLTVDEKLLQEKAEAALLDAARALDPKLAAALTGQDYARAFELLLSLRAVIDTFFDDVMVMCDDQELSANRLALLASVKSLFLRVADLSQIVVEG